MGHKRHAEFLDEGSLWKTLARRSKGQRKVACPYVGEGASKLLPWKKGDVLVCALSKLNARAGNVCPAEIEKLRKEGVQVYVEPDLHAKVMRCADYAVVGSANLSYRSKNMLDEAGVVVRDTLSLAAIDFWFAGRMGDPVSPGLLAECKKAYRKPKWPPLGEPIEARTVGKNSSKLWIITTQFLQAFPEHEQETVNAAMSAAKKKLKEPKSYCIERIRWAGGRFGDGIKAEDLVIQVLHERGQYVSPHGRVLSVRRTKTRRGETVRYVCVEYPRVYLEDPIAKSVMTGGELRRKCRSLGLKLGAGDIEREVRAPAARRALRGFCSPELIS